MEERKGRDMAKVVLGCLLIIGSVVALYLRYPEAPKMPSAGKSLSGAPIASQYWAQTQQLQQSMDQLASVQTSMAAYFMLLRLCLGCVIVGGFLLYTSPSPDPGKS